jgi:hypothetical protein
MNLKPLVNNSELYRSFQEYVQNEISNVQKHLEHEPEPMVIYQLQGEIRRLRKFLTLKERVNETRGS